MGLKLSKGKGQPLSKEQQDRLTQDEEAVNVIVQRYLQNSSINNPFIPDVVEKRLYINVLKLIIGVMKDTVEHSNVDILGYRINFTMNPCPGSRELFPDITTQTNVDDDIRHTTSHPSPSQSQCPSQE